MTSLRSRLSISAVLFVLGLLLVVQFRAQGGGPALEQRGAAELTTLIANLTTSNDALGEEVATLEERLRVIDRGGSQGGVSTDQLRADLERLRRWAGLDAAVGPGVEVAFTGSITADAVNDVLDELRATGAEALAVGPVRVVPGTVVGGNPGGLSIENEPLGSRVAVRAIGDSTNLAASLVRPDGVVARIQATLPDVTVDVAPLERLEVPAATRSLAPAHARP